MLNLQSEEEIQFTKKYKIKMSTSTIPNQANKENQNDLNESNQSDLNYKLVPSNFEKTSSKSFKSLFNEPVLEVLKDNEVVDIKNVRLIDKKENNLEISNNDEKTYGINKLDYKKIEITMTFLIKKPNKTLENIISSVENESSLSKSRRQMLSKKNDKQDLNNNSSIDNNSIIIPKIPNIIEDQKVIHPNLKDFVSNNDVISNNSGSYNPFKNAKINNNMSFDFGASNFGNNYNGNIDSNNNTYKYDNLNQDFPRNPFRTADSSTRDESKNPFIHVLNKMREDYNAKNNNNNEDQLKKLPQSSVSTQQSNFSNISKNPFANLHNNTNQTNTIPNPQYTSNGMTLNNTSNNITNNNLNETSNNTSNNVSNNTLNNPFQSLKPSNNFNPFLMTNTISSNNLFKSVDIDAEDMDNLIENPEEELPIESNNNAVVKQFEEVKKTTNCLYKINAEKLSVGLVDKKIIEGNAISIESSLTNTDSKEKLIFYRNKAGNILFSGKSIIGKTECKEVSIKEKRTILSIGPILNLTSKKFDNIKFSVSQETSKNVLEEIIKCLS